MKETLKKLLGLSVIALLTLSLAACGGGTAKEETTGDGTGSLEEDDPVIAEVDNGIEFEEEEEDAELTFEKAPVDKFYGTWEVTSDQSLFQYGNVTLTINENGTYTGNVSEEDVNGTWEENDEGIALTGELLSCLLSYTDKDVLTMRYTPNDDGDYITSVLTRKE